MLECARRSLTPLLIWLLLWSAGRKAFAQQYPFIPVPGAPKAIKTIFQDSRGRLWLGGTDLACFDGSRFFFLRDYGLPSVASYDIAEDASGAIWIGAETGVYRFSKGRVEEVTKGVAVTVLAASPKLVVAAVGPLGRGIPLSASLVRIQRVGDHWRTDNIMSLDSPGGLTLDDSGMLLYPWPQQGWNEIRLADVIGWRPGTSLLVIHHYVRGAPGNGSMKVMRDHSGCLWMGAPGGNTYECDDGPHPAPFDHADVESNFHEGSNGLLVLWGHSLLAVGSKGSFSTITPVNGLPGLLDAVPARDGTIWLGSPDGLYRFAAPFRLEYWTAREGLWDAPWSVARMGHKIYAGLNQKVVVLGNDRQRWRTIRSFQAGGAVSSLLAYGDGTLLAGFANGGVIELRGAGEMLARTEDHPRASSMRLTRTPNGEIWVGGHSLGLLTRRGTRLIVENHSLQTQPSGNVLAVKYEDHTDKLWACYNGGLVVRDNHRQWREITTRQGLLINGCWDLAPLPNGDVWYAYFNAPAIAQIRPGSDDRVTVRQYGRESGMPEPGGDVLNADQSGRMWRSGDLGIYVADPAEARAGKWLTLNESDGFPANDINSGSYFVDSDGSLWWGADNDLVHYVPSADLVKPEFAPQVFVSAFSVNGGAPRLAEATETLPHGSLVTAYIGSLQFDRRNSLRLRYRVLPERSIWWETGALDLALGKVSSGAHTLEVQARIFTGPWSPVIGRSFAVSGPAWSAWPFLVSYATTALLLAAGAFWLQRRRQAERVALLPDLAQWRSRVLLPELHQLAGTLLDRRYELRELLARGGFANVVAGYDRVTGRHCAIKVFRGEISDNAWIMRSFEHEVIALQQICHPNVVSIYAHGIAPSGAPYLVMEFVEGERLREILTTGPLPFQRVARFLVQLASALDAIHGMGICHRDVKPENVIVRNPGSLDEKAVLIDFSIAIVKDADETLHGLSRAAGTFDYMAPEQAVGYAQPSSDIYSLAKLVIEMLTGSRVSSLLPHAALDLPIRVRKILEHLSCGLSGESIDMLARSLEFDPLKRPNGAGGFASPITKDLETL